MKKEEILKSLSQNNLTILSGGVFKNSSILLCSRCNCKFMCRPVDLVNRSQGTCTVCRGVPDEILGNDSLEFTYDMYNKIRKITFKDYGFTSEVTPTKIRAIAEKAYFPTKEEIFKFVKGTDNQYAVSDLGTIIALKAGYPKKVGSKIDPKTSRYYSSVYIKYGDILKQRYVHQVVAETFLTKPDTEDKLVINHKDLDKTNNAVDNLEWCTQTENIKHAEISGVMVWGSRTTPVRLLKGDLSLDFKSQTAAARYLISEGYTEASTNSVSCYISCVINPYRKEQSIYGFTIEKI